MGAWARRQSAATVACSRYWLLGLTVTCGLAVVPENAVAQQEIRMTVSAGRAPVFPWIKHLKETFIPAVDAELAKTGRVRINWTEAYGGSLAKLGSEFETIEQGISDMGYVGMLYHPGKLPLQTLTFSVPFGPTDPRLVTRLMNRLNAENPAVQRSWDRHNQLFLTGISTDSFSLVSAFPLTAMNDLNGRKIGSIAMTLGWIKGTGAVGVSASLPGYYSDISSGIYAGTLIQASAATPSKLYEVAPNLTQVGFGAMYAGALTVNKRRWDRLPDEVKAAFRVAAQRYDAAYHDELEARSTSALAAWTAGGGRVTELSEQERIAFARKIDDPTKVWLAQVEGMKLPAREFLESYMKAVRAEGGRFARDWDLEQGGKLP